MTGAVRGSGATPDNSGRGEGRSCSQEVGRAALLVVLVAVAAVAVVVGGSMPHAEALFCPVRRAKASPLRASTSLMTAW